MFVIVKQNQNSLTHLTASAAPKIHITKEAAIEESKRLAEQNPGSYFYVMEAVHKAKASVIVMDYEMK
jgi:hypothetical protein